MSDPVASLAGQAALVTGASGGIGAALALALAGAGADLLLSGRSAGKLDEVAASARKLASRVEVFAADLEADENVRALAARAGELFGGTGILVHGIGLYRGGRIEEAPIADLDAQIRVNLRIPWLLTRELLPSLLARRGQVVFVNSGAGHHPGRASWGAYAASKHALRAFAESLREEVGERGVRVLTVYPGRTATPMQEEVHRFEGKPYDPGRFLQPSDVAAATLAALSLPRTAEVTDLHLRPGRF